jgi:hypothetical protein
MNNYEIQFTKARFVVSYSRGKLRKVEVKKGNLDLELLAEVVPDREDSIEPHDRFVKMEPKAKDQFFALARKAWMEFYRKQSGLDYRFLAADGKALKEIGKYMKEVSGSDEDALEAWKFILQRWNRLDPFYRKNADLKFVNSQLNKIINQLKNGTNTGQTASRNTADDLRRRFSGGVG